MNKDFLNNLIKKSGNEYAGRASEEDKFNTVGFIDTGSYSLNALVSGSIYGGFADDRSIGLAGEEATGKTFFALGAMKHFLDDNPNSYVIYFESENALDTETIKARGIDPDRIAIMPVATIEEFRTQAVKIIDDYRKDDDPEKPRIAFALDSLGNISTKKEVEDMESGDNKRDMTKQQLIRGAFRVLSLKLGKSHVPIIVTNHIYEATGVSFGDPRIISGGGGLRYAASTILMLSKAQHKEGDEVKGAVITCTTNKSRFTREKLKCKVLLHHEKGLDRYYGLLEIAEKAGAAEKMSKQYKFPHMEKGAFEKNIYKNPEKFFTQEVLDKIDEWTRNNWTYGSGEIEEPENETE